MLLSLCMGTGTDVIAGLLEGYDVIGVDFSDTMFDAARLRVETFLFNQRQVVQGALDLYAQQDADAEAYLKLGEVVDEAVKDQEKEDVIARQKLLKEFSMLLAADGEPSRTANMLYLRWVATNDRL